MFKFLADFIISQYEFLGLEDSVIILSIATILIEAFVLNWLASPTPLVPLFISLVMNAASALAGIEIRAVFGFNTAGFYAHYILGEQSTRWYGDAAPPGYVPFIFIASFLLSLLAEGVIMLLWQAKKWSGFTIGEAFKALIAANLASYALWAVAVLMAA